MNPKPRVTLVTQTQNDARLLTPGPLTTSHETKEAMLHDWGSRDTEFIEINTRVRNKILEIAEVEETHICIPLQGSGTFSIEATLGTMIPSKGKALILINGAYGHRMAKILTYMKRNFKIMETLEDRIPDIKILDENLSADQLISHVLLVHCETTSGILNPVAEIADIVADNSRSLIIDSMSTFGAIPLNGHEVKFDALVASSNKCLEGVPGMGFALIRKDVLKLCKGNAHSLSLDLYDQWQAMEANGQWRFTPPTHVIAALDKAIEQFEKEGGVTSRHRRYTNNCRIIMEGMMELGFEPLLQKEHQAPIILTFKIPTNPTFDFNEFYERVKERGYVLYPGKLTIAQSFRIGCIGHLDTDDMQKALDTMKDVLHVMGYYAN